MTTANSQFFAILTAVGEAKQANANALGQPWTFSHLGVGDANGTDPVPAREQTRLINERRRAPLNQLKVDPANPSIIIAEQVIPPDVGGWWIREIGLYDAAGDLVAVANCAPSYKPLLSQGTGKTQVVRLNIVVTSTDNVQLKIDPAVVLATREYVDQKVLAELSKQDFKHSVLVATTGPVALNGLPVIDDVPLTAEARVLVKHQALPKDNGLYSVSAAGVWTRSADADSSLEVTPGLFVHVERGTLNGDSVWQLVSDAPIVLGASDLLFEMVSGRSGVNAGTYRSVTVDKYGRVIGGTNPTTLAGYGIDIPTQAEAEAQINQDNAKPTTVLRVWQAITKKFNLFFQTGLADATIGKGMLVGAGGLMGAVEPFTDANAIPWRTGFFGASSETILNGPPGATSGDQVRQEVFNQYAAAQHWTCYTVNRKYTRRWQVNAWTLWDEDLTVSSIGTQMTATQAQTNSGVDDTKYVTPKKFAAGVAALVIQATEAFTGIAKIATQLQINMGTDDATIVTPKKLYAYMINAVFVQATEVVFGMARVGSKAVVDAGYDDTVIVTPKKLRWGFASSFNVQGYIVFPSWLGGLIIQWTNGASMGPGTAGAVYWPLAFPQACLWAIAVPRGSAGNASAGNLVAGNISTTAVELFNWGPINTPSRILAIGA